MANGNIDQLFQQLTQARQRQTRQTQLSQQLGGVSDSLIDFFVQKEQRKDEKEKNKLKRSQRLEDLTDEFELKDKLAILKNRRTVTREADQNRREDLRNLELDVRASKTFTEQKRKSQVAEAQRQQQLDQQKQKTAKGPKISQGRFQAATFANRIAQAEQIFSNLLAAGFDPTTKGTRVQRALPEVFKSQLIKQQEQAERNFVNAVLRRESGAAIAPSEFDSAEKQYFPRIGDSEKVLEQKKQNRAIVLQGLQAEARGILPELLQAP